MSYYWLFLLCTVSYFIGSISSSVIISRVFLKSDLRKSGSGNAGATNMLRGFGLKWAVIVLVLDILKGVIPSLVGLFLYNTDGTIFAVTEPGRIGMYACGLAAVAGHCFPVFLKFKGGKGVATTAGVFFVANPGLAAIALGIGILYAVIFEYASISSFIFVTAVVLWDGFMKSPGITTCILLVIFYIFIIFNHRANIKRLLTGGERRAKILGKLQKNRNKRNQEKWLADMK